MNFGTRALSLLGGEINIVGKSLVVYQEEDYLGTIGEFVDYSKIDGGVWKRLGCCVITKIKDDFVPIGGRCDSSKENPGLARPLCDSKLCCGEGSNKSG